MDALRVAYCKACKKWFLAQWVSTITQDDALEFEDYKKRGCEVVDYQEGRQKPLSDDFCQCNQK